MIKIRELTAEERKNPFIHQFNGNTELVKSTGLFIAFYVLKLNEEEFGIERIIYPERDSVLNTYKVLGMMVEEGYPLSVFPVFEKD